MTDKKTTNLIWGILLGVILGLLFGTWLGPTMLKVEWIGTLFLNSLKMTIIPLVLSAVICGVSSLGDIRKLGPIGGFTILYYVSTTAIAVIIGLVIVNILKPGAGISAAVSTEQLTTIAETSPNLTDIPLSMIAPNLVEAAAQTKLLPIIVFSLLFAAALSTIGTKAKPIVDFFEGLNETMMKIVSWLMIFAPLGIFSLISARLGAAGGGESFWLEIMATGKYVLAVLFGLFLHFMFLLGLLTLLVGGGLQRFFSLSRALLTAFGTASSSATLPVTMDCLRSSGVDDRSVKFVLPLGATINMDGTALYEAVAVMFIAQAYGIEMSAVEQLIIFVTATLAAIGAAGIPQA
ncbi:MAG: dicarboxylate/amino acid:cation symporter, partial [Pseudomonadota bacterium]|nr:dicarboxylate/amino acid:cation symporter [Pseudomonadota bacterium]